MVKKIAIASLTLLALAACSPGKWWGEPGPAPLVIEQPNEGGATCIATSKIFAGTEAESTAAFECLATQIDSMWKDVRGGTRDRLTEREISTLARAGVFVLTAERSTNVKRAIAFKHMLGFAAGVHLTREGIRDWLSWIRTNRAKIRQTYMNIALRASGRISFDDVSSAIELASEAMIRASWTMSSEELGDLISAFMPAENPYLAVAKEPLAKVAINIVAALCPTIIDKDRWNTKEIGSCLPAFRAKMARGAALFEYWLNPTDLSVPFAPIVKAIDDLKPAVASWFTDSRLASIDTILAVRLAQKLDLQVNERSLESIRWIRRFDPMSNERALQPRLMVRAFEILGDHAKSVLEGVRNFTNCENQNAKTWMDCQPKYPEQLREKSKSINDTLRIRNTHYARQALPYDGAVYSHILLFKAASAQLIKAFDLNGDGLITVDEPNPDSNSDNEVGDLVSVGLLFLKNTNFIMNISHRLRNEPIENETTSDDVAKFNLEGLTKLVTLVGDTLVWRDKSEKDFLRDILRSLPTGMFSKSALQLDQLRLAGVIWLLDSLTTIRKGYFNPAYLDTENVIGMRIVPGPDGDPAVSRPGIMKALPNILRAHYPRLYRSCMKFGWEVGCPIVFDQILPNPVMDGGQSTDLVYASALDLVTLAAVVSESLLDACDQNRDGRLKRTILTRNDELDCVFMRGKDMAIRLIKAKIVPNTPGLGFLLNGVNIIPGIREIPQIAMIRGTRHGAIIRLPIFFLHQYATLGSIYSLVGESMNPPAHKAAQRVLEERLRREEEYWRTHPDEPREPQELDETDDGESLPD